MINALQHVGLGVRSVEQSYDFYRRLVGFNLKIADQEGFYQQMAPILGEAAKMRIIMAVNSRGGGAIEIVEHRSSPPVPPAFQPRWGDLGFLTSGYRVSSLSSVVGRLEKCGTGFEVRSYRTRLSSGETRESAFLRDPDGNLVELVDTSPGAVGRPSIGGLFQVTIGVSDIERSLKFYRDLLGYDEIVLQRSGAEPELFPLFGGEFEQRQALLQKSGGSTSSLAMLDSGRLRLVQVMGYKGRRLYEGRRWGDIGQMECCFDVDNIEAVLAEMKGQGVEIFHPPTFMDMGSGSRGTFAYIKDPDDNLIEFVEVRSIAWLPPRVVSPALRAVFRVLNLLAW